MDQYLFLGKQILIRRGSIFVSGQPSSISICRTRLPFLLDKQTTFDNQDHSRFLVNQSKNSRSKTTTIPRFATLRQTRLDFQSSLHFPIEPPFSNRASIFQSSLHFPIEPPFFNRASIFQSSLHFSIEPRFFNRGSYREKKKRKKNGGEVSREKK